MPPTSPSDPSVVAVEHEGARATARHDRHGWEVDLTAGTGRLDVGTATRLLGALAEAIAGGGGGTTRWRVPAATAEHRRIAAAVGYDGSRRLVQMRRQLPLPWSATIPTRPFRPGVDDDDWLRVNNAAFHWHPEQGAWTTDELRQRLAEPWFDRDGFLVHPPTGPLDGFCWTKIHHDLEPPVGEIFVIGVHPEAAGRGLGRQLVLAGLDHLSARGLGSAMLYTEADNAPARAVYDGLGFTVHHEVTVFERDVEAARVGGSDADAHR